MTQEEIFMYTRVIASTPGDVLRRLKDSSRWKKRASMQHPSGASELHRK